MPQPRKALISLSTTPFYHCMSRCVRRAFLCGVDDYSGQSYEHRRGWLEGKLHQTADAFAIKLCAYAVMNNHYHVVLNVRSDLSASWSNHEVVERWHRLFSGTPLSQQFELGVPLSKPEQELLSKDITLWRHRLTDISWFMRIVNESIARQANSEDKCTGRFWEGRFKSQALLDDKALLACMAYVDLNPIRAKVAKTPETSEHTSIKQRIENTKSNSLPLSSIEDFVGSKSEDIGLPFNLIDYIELVDWTGRILRDDKRGSIDPKLPPVLERLKFNNKKWQTLTTTFETQFSHWVGQEHAVKTVYEDNAYQRIPSTKACLMLLG
ncbi:MAG: REP element-mobilizing transposase RayT [Cryomorphaceae bacterium]|jgi:REP element-mobilizing transposase RayT